MKRRLLVRVVGIAIHWTVDGNSILDVNESEIADGRFGYPVDVAVADYIAIPVVVDIDEDAGRSVVDGVANLVTDVVGVAVGVAYPVAVEVVDDGHSNVDDCIAVPETKVADVDVAGRFAVADDHSNDDGIAVPDEAVDIADPELHSAAVVVAVPAAAAVVHPLSAVALVIVPAPFSDTIAFCAFAFARVAPATWYGIAPFSFRSPRRPHDPDGWRSAASNC